MCLRIYSYISQILRTASLFNGDSAELLKTCQGKLKSLYKRLNCGNLYEVLKLIAIEETGVEKVYFTSLVLGAMLVSANAFAVDSTGCGLGSMAWRGQKGIGPQVWR